MPIWKQASLRVAGVATLLGVLFLQLLAVNLSTSMSWDEGHHLFDGYTIVKHHDYGLNPEVPPLAKVVAALAILPMHLYEPVQQGRSSQEEAFRDGKDFLFRNNADRMLLYSRMAISGFTVLLGLLVFLAGEQLFNTATGFVALAFLVFDPNLLAHGALVTTDAAITCLVFATVFAWIVYLQKPSSARLLLTGLVAGLALATKFTGIFLLPVLLAIAVVQIFAQQQTSTRPLRFFTRNIAALAIVFCIAYGVLWSCYGFRYTARPAGLAQNPTLTSYLKDYAQVASPKSLETLAHWHALPEAYLWGLANTKITEERDVTYFFGKIYRHGTWLYFPAAIAIKSTLPFLLMLVGVAVYGWRGRKFFWRWLALLMPVVIFLAFAMHADMNIGIRHILPIYPFLYLIGASALCAAMQRNRRWLVAIILLLSLQAISSMHSFPGYIAYANEAWGGPAQVHRYLGDSNSDWGQQLKTADAYLRAHAITDCWMAYTASGVVDERYYGVPCRPLPTAVNLWWLPIPMQVPTHIDGTVLISDDELEGTDQPAGVPSPYAAFKSMQPTATLDGGLFVYQGSFDMSAASKLAALAAAAHAGKVP